MSGRDARARERRETLAELDSVLHDRLRSLDEPVDRGDWAAVVQRSRKLRLSRYRSPALVASGAAVLLIAFTSSLVPLFRDAGHPGPEAGPLRLSLHLSDGSGLVLYSVAERARILDDSQDGPAGEAGGRSAAIPRSLSSGQFDLRAASVVRQVVTDGPRPGDRALVSFRVFTNPGLGTPAGSAVLACQYGLDRTAYCDGAVDLQDGVRLTGSGTMSSDADHYTLTVTGGIGRGVLTASREIAT
jgi:hypothetical protein